MLKLARRKIAVATVFSTTIGVYYLSKREDQSIGNLFTVKAAADAIAQSIESSHWVPPSRFDVLQRLKGNNQDGSKMSEKDAEFDILIIGGGATGVGCALDAATRGLKTCLVEKDDFGSGTSSRSTKLIHGGVRYLEKAFLELDYGQYSLVREALHERGTFLKIAPYLAHEIPIMLPLTKWWKIPYFFAGAKAYDILAGSKGLSPSYFLSRRRALEIFPMLKSDGLSGALVYYDGAHNDSRMNIAIALTAAQHGASMANHVEVLELIKKPRETLNGHQGMGNEEICGAVVRDTLTGDTWTIKAKGVINATGPFCDSIRKMDQGIQTKEIVAPSAGVHVVLPSYFSPRNMGLIDPQTSDGRVIFFLPWEGSVIAGTTDSPTKVTANPVPGDEDINWILKEVANYLSPDIKLGRGDVLAAWSGIRPLVRDPAAKNTESLVRNHMINVSEAGLLTIAGGKWTTYRAMAEETVDKAIEIYQLRPKNDCVTENTLIIGSHNWTPNLFIKLIQNFGLEVEVATHLAGNYGDRAWAVASMASQTGSRWPIFGTRIAMGYPYIEAEVRYTCRREYACTAVDVLARRTRLSFLNAKAALESIPRVIDIMAVELGWTPERKKQEYEQAKTFLYSMGLSIKDEIKYPVIGPTTPPIHDEEYARFFARTHFLPHELQTYKQIFASLDFDNDSKISSQDFSKALGTLGLKMSQTELEQIISEVDLNKSGSIEFIEFLQVLAAVKDIRSRSKFARIIADYQDRKQFPTDRSGGGI